MHDDAEVVVERGNDIKHGEDGEDGMLRFDQRQKDEILAHEAGGRRNTREGKHEDQKQQCRGGAALVQTVQVFELFADQSLLPKHDDHRERARGHEHIGEQVEGNAGECGFVPGNQSEQDVTHMGDRGVGQQTLHVGLREGGEVAPGQRGDRHTRDEIHPGLL